jgi:IclR family acetate operon transcriptional repressor
MDLMHVLSKKPQGLTLDELADIVDLHRSTVYRILITLEQEGIVERTLKRPIMYVLGIRCLLLRAGMLEGKGIMPQTEAILEAIAASTGESAGIYVRWGNHRTCIASSSSTHLPRYRLEVGQTVSLCTGAAGKLLLAYLPYLDARSILQESLPLIRRYPGTVSEVDVVLEELHVIRAKGFAVSTHELSFDAKSVAVPVWDSEDSVCAALGVTARTERLPDSLIPALVTELNTASRRLQHLLGGR